MSRSSADVLVVGGGLAGLSCALHLHRHGQGVRLFEASDAVGGRVRTDHIDGFQLDRGFQVFLTAYPEAKRVLDESALHLHAFHPGALVRIGGRFRRVGDPRRRPRDTVPTLLSPIGSIPDKVRVAILGAKLARRTVEQLLAGDDIATEQWLADYGFSSKIIERFFRPFLGGVFLERDLRTSSRMFRFVFGMFASGEAAVPRKGMGAIPAQLLAGLPDGAVRVRAPVARVEPHAVILEDGQRLEGRCVVVATDFTNAQTLLSETGARAGSGTTCLYYDAPAAPISEPILVLNGEGAGWINNLHVASAVNPACAPEGRSLVSVTVLSDGPGPARVEAAVRNELAAWFGEIVRGWRHLHTYRIPQALPAQPPGSLTPSERPVRTPGGIYQCGDHLDQASIQGAMVSGRRAADAVLSDTEP